MTSTSLATLPANLPAFLMQDQDFLARAEEFNQAAAGGIRTGGFPRISMKGSKFFIYDSSADIPKQLITNIDPETQQPFAAAYLDVVVVGANPDISKVLYKGAYVEGEDREPDCSSDNGKVPDAHIEGPPSPACATCPMNAWGSKINEATGKQSKACSDSKRLVILPAKDLHYKACAISVPPSALGDWGAYITKTLRRAGQTIPVFAVVTRITFDPAASHPKPLFHVVRMLSEEEYRIVKERMTSDEVRNIERPLRQERSAALPAPVQTGAPLPSVAPPPTPATEVQAAVSAATGFGGTPAPVLTPAPAPVLTPAPAPVAPPPPADPMAGLPDNIRATVMTLGGPDSPVGAQIIAAHRATMGAPATSGVPAVDQAASRAAVATDPPKPRGRPRKPRGDDAQAQPAAEQSGFGGGGFGAAPAPSAPVSAPQPAPAASNPNTGFASSPEAVVAGPGTGVAGDLNAMLANIMGGAAQ